MVEFGFFILYFISNKRENLYTLFCRCVLWLEDLLTQNLIH